MLNVTVDLFFWSYTFIQVENMQIMDKMTEMHSMQTVIVSIMSTQILAHFQSIILARVVSLYQRRDITHQ